MKDNRTAASFLFDLADTGLFTLPAELTDARNAVDRLRNLTLDQPAEESHVIEDQADAVARGSEIDTTPVLDARAAADRADAAKRILDRAREIANTRLGQTLAGTADQVISDSLAPVLGEAARELATLLPKVAPIDGLGTEALIRLPKAQSTAYLRFGELADQHHALMTARMRLLLTINRKPANDTREYFAAVRNFEHVAPSILGLSLARHAHEVPRDVTHRTYLTWVLSHGGELWCPTLVEQEARWEDVFGERVREQAAHRHNMEGFRTLGESALARR